MVELRRQAPRSEASTGSTDRLRDRVVRLMGTTVDRLASPPLHRALVLAIIGGLVLFWGLAVMGISLAMAENDVDRWWVLPLFGIAVLALALIAAYLFGPSRNVIETAQVADSNGSPAVTERHLAATKAEPRADVTVVESLSDREIEILSQVATGKSNREIATELYVAIGTVKAHINNVFRKLSARNRTEAVARARELRLID